MKVFEAFSNWFWQTFGVFKVSAFEKTLIHIKNNENSLGLEKHEISARVLVKSLQPSFPLSSIKMLICISCKILLSSAAALNVQ